MNEKWAPIILAPKDRMLVLAWAGIGTTRGFFYMDQWIETGSGKVLEGLTHWQDLPMPPIKID